MSNADALLFLQWKGQYESTGIFDTTDLQERRNYHYWNAWQVTSDIGWHKIKFPIVKCIPYKLSRSAYVGIYVHTYILRNTHIVTCSAMLKEDESVLCNRDVILWYWHYTIGTVALNLQAIVNYNKTIIYLILWYIHNRCMLDILKMMLFLNKITNKSFGNVKSSFTPNTIIDLRHRTDLGLM